MTPRLRWLVLLCTLAGLSAVMAWEPGFDTDLAPWSRLHSGLPGIVEAPTAAGAPVAPDRAAAIVTIDARPLFVPGRRPVVAQPRASLKRVVGPAAKPEVSGIIITANDRFALLAAADGAEEHRARKLRPGDQVGQWTVQAIDVSGVTFAGPEGRAVVRPAFHAQTPPPALLLPPPSPRQSGYSPVLMNQPYPDRPAAQRAD